MPQRRTSRAHCLIIGHSGAWQTPWVKAPETSTYLEKMRVCYRRHTSRLARSKLISDFCAVTSHERKYAIKLLHQQRGPGSRSPAAKRGIDTIYGQEVVDAIFEIWRHGEQPCGKRLKPMLKEWLPHYQLHYGQPQQETESKVLAISPAQIDRVLAKRKVGFSKRKPRTPKTNAAIKALVPIRAESWDAREPGWIEADTVAHCGGNMGESFIWSLTMTDIFSGWTEVRPSWNRGQERVLQAFSAMEAQLPFEMLGVDTGNGGEFLNYHLHDHLTKRDKPIEMTRSRPYRKNDQARVEQKNDTHDALIDGIGNRFSQRSTITVTSDAEIDHCCAAIHSRRHTLGDRVAVPNTLGIEDTDTHNVRTRGYLRGHGSDSRAMTIVFGYRRRIGIAQEVYLSDGHVTKSCMWIHACVKDGDKDTLPTEPIQP